MTLEPRPISHAPTTRDGFRRPTTTMFGIGLAVLGVVAFVATAIGPIEDTGLDDEPPAPTGSDAVNVPAPDAAADGDEEPRAARPKSIPTPIPILDCRDPRLDLDDDQREALAAVGFSRCAMPFGVLLAADDRMPASYLELAAAVLAEMLDQDQNGVPDDAALVDLLKNRDVAWLAMPTDRRDWERRQLPRLERVLGYDIVIPAWWLDVRPGGPDRRGRAVTVEEIHHFITQFGLSRLHPAVFGVDDWTSVIARETARAKCVFWQHPENDCPGRPAESPGDCSDPNCDVVEFFQQAVVLRAGMKPGWRGIGFPETAATLEPLLSPAFKAVLDDPAYHQLRRPLRFDYPVAPMERTSRRTPTTDLP
ncbi:MAG: hypothetical protein GY704_06450 [Phycisphaeraceae bacterium]|nr:hypothetical protein [Phycisphaeraceae bacterium]